MQLVCHSHKQKNARWELKGHKLTIGRDATCNIVIHDPKVSRIHAEILFENGRYIFVDKNSTNGSFINGTPVYRQMLMPGDILTLGATQLTVQESADINRIQWQEDAHPLITSMVPLNVVDQKISRITALYKTARPGREIPTKGAPPPKTAPRKEPPDLEKTEKLLKNLEIIYTLSRAFTSVMVLDDLYNLIEKTLYSIFPKVQRFCLLAKSDSGKDFAPVFVSVRKPEETKEFEISRSIFNLTIEKHVSTLTADAARDARFENAESVIDFHLRSTMCAPLVSKRQIIGAIYCDNRTEPACFDKEDLELLTAMANQVAVAIENASLYEDIQKAYHEAILALINAIEAKDPYTMGHTQRTSRYALGIAQELGLGEQRCYRIKTAAELHDIGKIGIKEHVLTKRANLTQTEFLSVKEHVQVGEKILKPIAYLRFVLPIIRGHHEHFDGTGYPDSLKGEQIMLESRILSVADAFDAMTTQRPYNSPLSFSEALNECKKHADTHFDPKVVDALERFIAANYELTDTNLGKKMRKKGETSQSIL